MYGCRMRAKSEHLELLLRPYEPGEAQAMLPGMQSLSVMKYLGHRQAQTLQLETDWLTKVSTDASRTTWAICVLEDGVDRPIGTTDLKISETKSYIGSSGIVLYDSSWWGKGVATLAHLARTRYAFEVLNLCAIYSGAYKGNLGSCRALDRVGYVATGTRYHLDIVDGQVCHAVDLLLVNPNERSWNFFWGDSLVPQEFHDARQRTCDALARAQHQVEYL